MLVFFFKQKTAYEMRISDWSSDVCSSDLSVGDPRSGPPGRFFQITLPLLALRAATSPRPLVAKTRSPSTLTPPPKSAPLLRLEPSSVDHTALPVAASKACTRASVSRSEEHTSELQSLMSNSYAVFCL